VIKTVGYCGADLKALCAEAALVSLRRAYPQVYTSNVRLALDPSVLRISQGDFAAALNKVVPSSRREARSAAKPLDPLLLPLLEDRVIQAMTIVCKVFPPARDSVTKAVPISAEDACIRDDGEVWVASLSDVYDEELLQTTQDNNPSDNFGNTMGLLPHLGETVFNSTLWDYGAVTSLARLMVSGRRDMGQREVAAAVLQRLEAFTTHNLDLPALISDTNSLNVEQALVAQVQNAFKSSPSVLFLPDLGGWWTSASETSRTLLVSLVDSTPMNLPVFWLSTFVDVEAEDCSNEGSRRETGEVSREITDFNALDDDRFRHLLEWLSGRNTGAAILTRGTFELVLQPPTSQSKDAFFRTFFDALPLLPARIYTARKKILLSQAVILQPAIEQDPVVVIEAAANQERDRNCLRELRNFFRAVLTFLHKEKRYAVFCKPVDPEHVPDYYDVIRYPMDLETIRIKVDEQLYPTYLSFYRDFERILFNAREYNPITGKDSRGKNIVHAAHSMTDHIESYCYSFRKKLGYDLFKRCEAIARRSGIEDLPAPGGEDDIMMSSDFRFYAMILERHRELKEEMGAEHPSAQTNKDKGGEPNRDLISLNGTAAPWMGCQVGEGDRESRRSSRKRGETITVDFDKSPPKPRSKRKEIVKSAAPEPMGPDTVSTMEPFKVNNHSVDERTSKSDASLDPSIVGDTPLIGLSPEETIDLQPLMSALKFSSQLATTHPQRLKLQKMQKRLLQAADLWTIPKMVQCMTSKLIVHEYVEIKLADCLCTHRP
jgi:SpoVK/Ycf46/Vps4 family AAA+-type ATPase